MSRANGQLAPDISPQRRSQVDAARAGWIRQLVDLSRRNNLLYFRDLKVGTLDLTFAPAPTREALFSQRSDVGVALPDLVDPAARERAASSMQEIADRARSNFEERGLDTLFLAVGLASWTARDGGRDAKAPVLLVPIHASQAGGRGGTWKLKRAGVISLNSVLTHALHEEHGLTLDGEALLGELGSEEEGGAPDVERCLQALATQGAAAPGFTVNPRWVLGNFAFQKMAIVKDLERLSDALAAHDLIAGIAGDSGAASLARGDRSEGDLSLPDRTPPEQEFLIRDADSSQQQAIAFTLAGRNGVISGPPGTGKSQTIANLVAEMVARGKRVLFVAEKRAALDVVLNRLREADLDHVCLDCHGAELTRRHVAQQMWESLERIREAPVAQADDLHRTFLERRDRLNKHVRGLHDRREPGGQSVYHLYGQLAKVPEVPCAARLPQPNLTTLDPTRVAMCAERTRDLAGLAPLVTGESASPWVGGSITSSEQLRGVVAASRSLAQEHWSGWEQALTALLREAPVRPPERVGDVGPLLTLLSGLQATLTEADAAIFRSDLTRLQEDLQPAQSPFAAFVAFVCKRQYRAALGEVRSHVPQPLTARGALALVTRASEQLQAWRSAVSASDQWPQTLAALEPARTKWSAVEAGLSMLQPAFPKRALDSMALQEFGAWVRLLSTDLTAPSELLRIHQLEGELRACGFAQLLGELRAHRSPPATWPDMLRRCWLLSCLEQMYLEDPTLAAFRGSVHEQIAGEFRLLDQQRLRVAVQRVQRAHATAAIDAMNRYPSQRALVGKEANKKARHLPLRKLLAEAPDVMLALRPCWMASPLSVSQLIPGEQPLFDLVVFDEASQVLPEDAVTSLLRGRQAVIAGDSRQLPPTTFFAAGLDDGAAEDDGSGGGATQGFQSILDVMTAFLEPTWSLDWHYRSRDEALIAFSNHHIYGGRLVTFPGPGRTNAVQHVLVPHVMGDRAEASTGREVERVVGLVVDHAHRRPNESLGVITMGIEHAKRIEMALVKARQAHPDLEHFFDEERQERFFIKNLERVQGDERDAIILSIGYGKNEAGHLVYRFGPLLQEGGERRLNVAITRARQRMTVVSSFSHADMQADYPKLGVRLLRAFLEYAASGGTRLDGGTVTEVPLNEFEQSICDELTRRGLKIIPQLGTSRYRIDLVAVHPQKPGRYVLAIECDGATYHSAPTARDRDRLRQQQLEALGWRFHRIWSTDWFQRREEEVQRALKAFGEAVAYADALDEQGTPSGPVAPAAPAAPPTDPALTRDSRGPKPRVRRSKNIDEYSKGELVQLTRWLQSDGRLRTDEELVSELLAELGFLRRGNRIIAALTAAVLDAKRLH